MVDTSVPFNFSSKLEAYNSTDLPPEWLKCDRKSAIIAEKLIAFKAPLDDRFNTYIPSGNRWSCGMLINYIKNERKNLGLVIDLTNTDRYYLSGIEFIRKNIGYKKIPCHEDDEIPNDEQIDRFIQICHDFINTNPTDIIGVHCTYGYNQTGFFICAYLCRELHYNIHNAINLFEKARPPGITNQDYLNKLVQKFERNNLISTDIHQGPEPLFAADLVDVRPIYSQHLDNIRLKFQQMCGLDRQTFPGSKPVSMNKTNYETILKSPYLVSWKADGTRYMMLIENKDQIYMLDRSNNIFKINNLQFPNYDFSKHLTDTLIDGEFVIDKHEGKNIYRYLVYDIIKYENENIGQKIFNDRLDMIKVYIIDIRNNAISRDLIDKNLEPFSIEAKEFYELSKLLDPSFQSKITHGSDGLIFQPKHDPYHFGRSSNVLKWNTDNTIDFRLKIDKTEKSQDKKALLYLHNMSDSYASMRYSPTLDRYDNQIIECSYHNNRWNFSRHRSDKKYPNTEATANGIIEALKHPIPKEILYSLIDQFIAFSNYLSK